MKKNVLILLLAIFCMACAQETSIKGVWELSQKAKEGDIEKTEYWIISDSLLHMTSWKDDGAGTLEEIHKITDGFKFPIEIDADVIKLGEDGEFGEIKLVEVNEETATIEVPSSKEDGVLITTTMKRVVE